MQENRCHGLIIRNKVSTLEQSDQRVSLEDNTNARFFTITMSKRRVGDTGIYKCGLYYSDWKTIDVIKSIHLKIFPGFPSSVLFSATTLKPTKYSQTTIETPLTTKHSQTTTETPLISSSIPLVTSSARDNQKVIIWGSVLASLLLLGLLSVIIMYTVKTSQKPETGDDDCHHIYDYPEEEKQKTRNISIEMEEEGSGVIQYASVIHGIQFSLGDPIYTNTQIESHPDSLYINSEPVEYASIARTRHQLPK
ncbi:uncharacterized protein LOC141489208 [Macrotis lagotis]|uniref:uncharacterized protein LOC141489208 n=1 Tax=Macrotis lagotis TaxID=92651 RepID=UPI003D687AC2